MAKKIPAHTGEPRLFEQHERALDRRVRRQRSLFIPRYLREAAENQQLSGTAQDQAYAIAVRWAELESSGHIAKHKETSIDTQFLDQLFGEGLGYSVKTQSPSAWQLEHKFTVAGIGTADASLGEFPAAKSPSVVVELKDAQTDLDRDKSGGRTAVQQCWDYLNALPDCPWGIVSNFSTIRLYHRSKGNLAYEEFALQELRDRDRFNEFYALFERGGLLRSRLGQPSRAASLLERTQSRQRTVGDDLYGKYQRWRYELIHHLHVEEGVAFDEAIRVAQRLLDRIVFIAFCEDRGLLPKDSLAETNKDVRRYSRAKNPAWENFLDLFRAVDQGAKGKKEITAFNGGLFADDPAINALELEDEKWTNAFAGFGAFDFSEEVNVEVLGHLFERSITELEKLRVGGLFALKGAVEAANGNGHSAAAAKHAKGKPKKAATADDESSLSKMPKSAQRKRFGIYYTPPAFTGLIVERTVDALVRDRFAALARALKVDPESREAQDPAKLRKYWRACLECLKALTICDPACGSGAFLIRAYDAMDAHYKAVVHGLGGAGVSRDELGLVEDAIPDLILSNNLYGVDLSREGVEITQLALWIRSARVGRTLMDLSTHIVHGNSLVTDPAVDPHALDWAKTFPDVFGKSGGGGGFDCLIGNPPWEQIMLHDREFFALTHPAIATAVNAADRDAMIEALPRTNPDLHAAYQVADAKAMAMLKYVREGDDFPLTGKGRTNLYMAFAERAKTLVAPSGMVGLLVPSGIATDDTTKEFFNDLMDRKALVSLYDFENRNKVFEDVDSRFKFSAIIFQGSEGKTEQADFVFFAHDVDEVAESNKHRHIALTAADMKLLNPNTKTCPIFRTRRDANLTRAIYKRVTILIDKNRKQGGNPWGITFKQGLFNQTSDAKKFTKPEVLKKNGYSLDGNRWTKAKSMYLPLYEAKMLQAFDHRAASIVIEASNWMRQGQKSETSPVEHANPEFMALPRWWVKQALVDDELPEVRDAYVVFKDITSATNERTMIACFLPRVALVNSAPMVLPSSEISHRRAACLLANYNSFAYDFVARQKVGGNHLNFFIVEQLPTLPPDTYADKCPWSKEETLEHWISERVLKLSCTAEDMLPLAKACGFKGSRGDGVHIWKEQDRATLRAELDAAFFHLYGIERDDAEYVLSTFSGTGFVKPDLRDSEGAAWERGSVGAAVLDAFDSLVPSQR
ncbi:MAG: Eco57I restriction-modification methylase domain-containing protein [Phycisphaerales bacterium]